jgi:hypothetical protein
VRTKLSTFGLYALRIGVFAGAAYLCMPFVVDNVRIYLHARSVRNTPNAAEIAAACIQLVRNTTDFRSIHGDQTNEIPPVLRPMRPRYISIDARPPYQQVMVEFGGGFIHYGYELRALDPPDHGWSFSYYGENEEDRVQLLTVPP